MKCSSAETHICTVQIGMFLCVIAGIAGCDAAERPPSIVDVSAPPLGAVEQAVTSSFVTTLGGFRNSSGRHRDECLLDLAEASSADPAVTRTRVELARIADAVATGRAAVEPTCLAGAADAIATPGAVGRARLERLVVTQTVAAERAAKLQSLRAPAGAVVGVDPEARRAGATRPRPRACSACRAARWSTGSTPGACRALASGRRRSSWSRIARYARTPSSSR
jgi:hypothetical protein